jgi:hypothetical protein
MQPTRLISFVYWPYCMALYWLFIRYIKQLIFQFTGITVTTYATIKHTQRVYTKNEYKQRIIRIFQIANISSMFICTPLIPTHLFSQIEPIDKVQIHCILWKWSFLFLQIIQFSLLCEFIKSHFFLCPVFETVSAHLSKLLCLWLVVFL